MLAKAGDAIAVKIIDQTKRADIDQATPNPRHSVGKISEV